MFLGIFFSCLQCYYCASYSFFLIIMLSVFDHTPFLWLVFFVKGVSPLCLLQGRANSDSMMDLLLWLYCCSVTKLCLTLCSPMDCSMPGFLVLHYLPEFAQTHVHWVDDAIQPSHPLSFPSLPSCPQSFPASGSSHMNQFFRSGGQSIGVSASASVLPMNIQDWFPLGLTGLISLQSKGPSRIFSNTTVQKHQFFGAQPSLWSNSDIHI